MTLIPAKASRTLSVKSENENKEFELVVLPGVNHTLGGKFGERKRRDFFVKNLLHVDPPDWNKQ